MESLRWQLFDQYGTDARIIRAEKIQTGGLFGLGATTSFEVLVEVDSELAKTVLAGGGGMAVNSPVEGITLRAPSARRAVPSHLGTPARGSSKLRAALPRRNMKELLAAADDGDDARPSAAVAAGLSAAADGGSGPDFHTILHDLSETAGELEAVGLPHRHVRTEPEGQMAGDDSAAAAIDAVLSGQLPQAVPRPLTTPGAVVVLAGRRDQPLATAWSMAGHLQDGADVLTAGDHRHYGTSHVFLDSVEVQKAQAAAAHAGKPLLIAFSFGQRGASKLSMLGSVRSQQLWFVVDAAHKPEDTSSWVGRACRYSVPDGLAVLGVTDTATPESVNALKIPIGWVDGRQATTSEL